MMSAMTIRNDDGATAVTDDVIADAKRCWQLCQDADNGNRELAIDDLQFLNGDPLSRWGDAFAQRSTDGRPALVVNTLPATVALVVNDIRQNRQSIHVHPVGGGADDDVAEVMEGIIRHIEYDSNADAAYDTAVGNAAANGFGFFRLLTEYESAASFDQKMVIKRVRNPFTVYFDPLAQEADGSDARFCLISTRIGKADFKREYPDAQLTNDWFGSTWDGVWQTSDEVRVAEFYRVEYTKATLCLLNTGESGWKDELPKPLPFGVAIVKERESFKRKVMWYKLTGAEKLAEAEVPFYWIPVFPVWGQEIDIDGRIARSGIVRNAKDPSRMYDFFLTTATEEVALRPRTPYIGAVGQFETAKADWATANQVNYSFLEYDPVTVDGTIVGAPQRQPMADVPVGNLQMCAIMRDNIKATTGIYDASLGARSNETSGVAIRGRQRQGDIANFHLSDNLSRSIRHLGRTMVSGFGRVYDTRRVMRLLAVDGTATTAEINAPTQEQNELGQAIDRVLNDMTTGEYDVVVSSGPGYSTLRQEAAESMTAMAQSYPEIMQVAGDQIVKSMDWPGHDEISDRLASFIKLKFPGLIKPEPGEEEENAEPMVQTPNGAIPAQQAGQLIGQMNQALEAMQDEIDKNTITLKKAEIDAASREEVARINATSRQDVEELKGMIAMLTAQMVPPPALVEDAMTSGEETAKPDAMAAYMEQIAAAIANQSEATKALASGLTAPREVVRDPKTGRAIGMRAVMPEPEAMPPEAAPEAEVTA
jgi:hypothetical protein